ncbi:pentatricopeptide repeat-containing protein At1g32415, mitochondrial [Argentina anserina]|uniref:pentatricopeptide repeat-containing protein At1g32415, mitochondrial n=1 Tax=Argentina anserina TaxID=57926 RepID=UPI0021767DEF|nr:pentatricopeptide repeat-containing protein At1g32415, mitochondrial [Potentilla anserina]
MRALFHRPAQFTLFKTVISFRLYTTQFTKLTPFDSELLRCLSQRLLKDARKVLDKMPSRDRHGRIVEWTRLVTKYSRGGWVDEARVLFDIMPERNVVSYNAMLSGYVQSGRLSEGWRFFEEMPERNVVSWTSMMCGLAEAGRVEDARLVFEAMPERNVVSWNSMVAGLVKNGDVEGAREVFEGMPVKNVVSCNVMIGGYAERCRMDEARGVFDGMMERNVVTWTSMVSGYCRCGDVDEGYALFREMPERNVVSWTAMIGGFAWNGFYKEALLLFLEMKGDNGAKPNGETFISLVYACAGVGVPQLGKQLHGQLLVNNWNHDDYDGRLSKGLIHMYSAYGIMDYAEFLFVRHSNTHSVQSCNSMINGYIQIEQLEWAQNLFDRLPTRDKISWTLMITGYFNVGEVSKACYMFQIMPDRDAISWTAMISGHIQNELFAEATDIFFKMRQEGVSPLNSTYSVLLGAAGAMSYLDSGRQFHGLLTKTHYELDLLISNSLISMYAKCGEIDDAYHTFLNMSLRDLISWNSMIMGFSDHGHANKTLKIFEAMVQSGTHPNSVTFLGILSACSHAGLVHRGWEFFNAMNDVYGIQPASEHCICMINLLGRAGKVKEARELVRRLPLKPDHAVWGALLGICGFGETNAEVAKYAAKHLLEIDPLNAPGHVVLCNIYAANGLHIEEKALRREMRLKGVKKFPGCSWILVQGRVNVFLSGDKIHPDVNDMLSILFGDMDKSQKESAV